MVCNPQMTGMLKQSGAPSISRACEQTSIEFVSRQRTRFIGTQPTASDDTKRLAVRLLLGSLNKAAVMTRQVRCMLDVAVLFAALGKIQTVKKPLGHREKAA